MGTHPSKKSFTCASGKEEHRNATAEAGGDWSFFDKVYCISLVNREDRRIEAREQFARVGLADRVEFLLVE